MESECLELLKTVIAENSSSKGWLDYLSVIGPILIGVLAVIYSSIQTRKTIRASKIEAERKEIYKKLNEFYGPFYQLRNKSNLLYKKFAVNHRETDESFTTLKYLLDGNKFVKNDKKILNEIIEVGKRCENLIHDKAGLIDDEILRSQIMPKVTTHYLILRLAFEKKLKGDSKLFVEHVFPGEVDELVNIRISELQDRLRELDKVI